MNENYVAVNIEGQIFLAGGGALFGPFPDQAAAIMWWGRVTAPLPDVGILPLTQADRQVLAKASE